MFKQPKPPEPVPTPNVADAQNRMDDSRRRRLASGGSNATFLANVAATGAKAPAKTLTGLQG